MIGLIPETSLQLSSGLGGVWESWSYLNNIVSVLSPDCAALGDFTLTYSISALLPLIVGFIFLEAYALSLLFAKCWKPDAKMDLNKVMNAYFSLIYTFFVAVCKASIDVFLCRKHPNGVVTLDRAPSITCTSEQWEAMVAVGVFALTVFCALSSGVFCYILYVAPVQFHNEVFRKRWSFLIMKYRPDVWWWGAIWLIKSFLMALVLLSQTSFGQLFGLTVVQCSYLVGAVSFNPWRHLSANMLERITSISVVVMIFLGVCNASFAKESSETTALAIAISFLPALLFLALAAGILLETFKVVQQQTLNRYKLLGKHIENSFRDLASLDSDTRALFLKNITSTDRKVLAGAADVILAELNGQQIRTSRWGQRLIMSPYVHDDSDLKRFPQLQEACKSGTGNNLKSCMELQLNAALPVSASVQAIRALQKGTVVVNQDV